jgi:hypothetical protein
MNRRNPPRAARLHAPRRDDEPITFAVPLTAPEQATEISSDEDTTSNVAHGQSNTQFSVGA